MLDAANKHEYHRVTGISSGRSMPVADLLLQLANADPLPYMTDMKRKIKRAWLPPKGHETDKVIVVFKIHQNGEISDLRLERSSGDPSSDNVALSAIKQAAPFWPFPCRIDDGEDMQFTFDSKLFATNW
jgi:TonB family protein